MLPSTVSMFKYMNYRRGPLRLFTLVVVLLLFACGVKTPPKEPLGISALLMEADGRLFLVLHNNSGMELTLCRRNFYLPLDYLDIKRYPDTTEFTFERVFGKKPCVVKRKNVTASDFVSLPPDNDLRLPVDLRCVHDVKALGDTVLVSVRFMNIDPFVCSRVEVKKYRPEIQEYCELLHFVPNKDLKYWEGEVKTPYYAFSFSK
jgi:hypothetical protein